MQTDGATGTMNLTRTALIVLVVLLGLLAIGWVFYVSLGAD
jgi:hypothetical protein